MLPGGAQCIWAQLAEGRTRPEKDGTSSQITKHFTLYRQTAIPFGASGNFSLSCFVSPPHPPVIALTVLTDHPFSSHSTLPTFIGSRQEERGSPLASYCFYHTFCFLDYFMCVKVLPGCVSVNHMHAVPIEARNEYLIHLLLSMA